MNIKPNEHFNPDECPYEVEGFYEEYLAAEHPHKGLGIKVLDASEAPRALGSDGRQICTLSEDVELKRGMKTITVKAGTKVITMVQALCGKSKHQFKAHQ